MSNAYVVPALQVRAWEKNMVKQKLNYSIFEQFSSRTIPTVSDANEGRPMVPSAVINSVSDKFNKGTMYVSILSMDKLKFRGPKGPGRAQGTEEVTKLRYSVCFYNTQRKAISLGDDSIDGDAAQAYPIASEQNRLLTDYFAELNDYDKHRALILGANEDLTDSESWQFASVFGTGTAPTFTRLHPNTYLIGQSTRSPVTWNATFDTHVGNLITAIRAAYSGGNATFTKSKLDKVISLATTTVAPLGWNKGGQQVDYIVVLSQTMADQLRTDTASTGWWATFKDAGARGADNKAITGLLGIYNRAMVIVDVRAPLFNAAGSGSYTGTALNRFQFVKAWADDSSKATNIDAGDNRVPATYVYNATAASDVGTMEIGLVLGLGAMLEAETKSIKYTGDSQDYDFSKGLEARQAVGMMRNDFTGEAVLPTAWNTLTVAPNNWSSMVFMCPTAAGSL